MTEHVRDLAIAIVDDRHGFTIEFAPSYDIHEAEYNDVESTIVSVLEIMGLKIVKTRQNS